MHAACNSSLAKSSRNVKLIKYMLVNELSSPYAQAKDGGTPLHYYMRYFYEGDSSTKKDYSLKIARQFLATAGSMGRGTIVEIGGSEGGGSSGGPMERSLSKKNLKKLEKKRKKKDNDKDKTEKKNNKKGNKDKQAKKGKKGEEGDTTAKDERLGLLGARNRNGETPLHSASAAGKVLAVKWLLTTGADINSLTAYVFLLLLCDVLCVGGAFGLA